MPDEPQSYRINDDADQIAREHDRLRVLARVRDPATRATLERIGLTRGWRCCDVGSGAGTIAAWMAEQVGPTGHVLSIDVDTRFQAPQPRRVEVRTLDVTAEPIGRDEFDVVHARGVLQHIAQRETVLDSMIAAVKPGGWVVVSDVDWIQFDEQDVPEPFASLSSTLRALSTSTHGYDGAWGRRLPTAFTSRGLEARRRTRRDVDDARRHRLGRVVRRGAGARPRGGAGRCVSRRARHPRRDRAGAPARLRDPLADLRDRGRPQTPVAAANWRHFGAYRAAK